jgi:hypothetical protein
LLGGFVVITEWYLTWFKLKYTSHTYEKGIFREYQNSVVVPSQAAFALIIGIQLVVVCTSESAVTMPSFLAAMSAFIALGAGIFFFKGLKSAIQKF